VRKRSGNRIRKTGKHRNCEAFENRKTIPELPFQTEEPDGVVRSTIVQDMKLKITTFAGAIVRHEQPQTQLL
jgi:hypothetical protein